MFAGGSRPRREKILPGLLMIRNRIQRLMTASRTTQVPHVRGVRVTPSQDLWRQEGPLGPVVVCGEDGRV